MKRGSIHSLTHSCVCVMKGGQEAGCRSGAPWPTRAGRCLHWRQKREDAAINLSVCVNSHCSVNTTRVPQESQKREICLQVVSSGLWVQDTDFPGSFLKWHSEYCAEVFILNPALFATFHPAHTWSITLSLGCLLDPAFERLPPGH